MKDRNPIPLSHYREDLTDLQLQMASWASRGIWATLIGLMHAAPEYGRLTGSLEQFCNAIGATKGQMRAFLADLRKCGFADLEEDGEIITISCRRMVYEKEVRGKQARQRKRRQREKEQTTLARESETVKSMSQNAHASSGSKEEGKASDAPGSRRAHIIHLFDKTPGKSDQ